MAQSIFSDGVLLTPDKHGKLSYHPGRNWQDCATQISAPITLAEFPRAAREFPILFARASQGVSPVAILGLSRDRNLFVDAAGRWTGEYIPAHFRQLPFFGTQIVDRDKMVLSVLPDSPELRRDDSGVALFDDTGTATPFLQKIVAFTGAHYANSRQTQRFCRRLEELDLLEPMTVTIALPGHSKRALRGFMTVSRERLAKLADDDLLQLARSGGLEAVHMHWASFTNFEVLAERVDACEITPRPVDMRLVSTDTIARQAQVAPH